jgi:hypothetical protein
MAFPANAIGLAAGVGAGYFYAENNWLWALILLVIGIVFAVVLS